MSLHFKGTKTIVVDNNFEKAFRKFKKKVNESGILKEVMGRQAYVKPTTKRQVLKAQAKKRWQRWLKEQELPQKYF